jgi:hypothetical protein
MLVKSYANKMYWNKFYFREIAIVLLSGGNTRTFITEYRECVVMMQAQIYCTNLTLISPYIIIQFK